RAAAAAAADGAPCGWRVPDERSVAAALGAAADVRKVPREPEQLQLEREAERLEVGAAASANVVEEVEESGERLERPNVRLLLDEQPQHRLRADQPDGQPERVLSRGAVRPHELDPGDGVELAAAAMEEQLYVRQRLEPPTEARAGTADAFRDRADTTAVERIEVENAIGLAETDRAEHDRLGLVRPPHAAKSTSADEGISADIYPLKDMTVKITMYTTPWCGYCVRAKALLDARRLPYTEIDLGGDPGFRQRLLDETGGWTVPQIVIDGEPIGG